MYKKPDPRKTFLVLAGLVLIIGFIIVLWYFLLVFPESTTSKYISMKGPVQSPDYQTGGNQHISQTTPEGKTLSGNADRAEDEKFPFSREPLPRQLNPDSQSYEDKVIQSIIVETRLTYELRVGAEVPPGEVPFDAGGDENSYLEGADGKVRLDFISPVGFKLQRGGRILVINRFGLQESSDLYWSPVEGLKKFDYISLPIITADYGGSLNKLLFFKASLLVNGQDILLSRLNRPTFQMQRGTIRIPLGRLKQWVDEVNAP